MRRTKKIYIQKLVSVWCSAYGFSNLREFYADSFSLSHQGKSDSPLRRESVHSCLYLLLSAHVSPSAPHIALLLSLHLCVLGTDIRAFMSPTPLPHLMRISVVLNMKSESRLRAINTHPLLLSVMKQSISPSLSPRKPVSCLSVFSGIGYWL